MPGEAALAYSPRHPERTVLYRLVSSRFDEFERVYPTRFQAREGYWRAVVGEVVRRYLACGILRHGFARVKCRECKGEFLVAFSCKARHVCPSCHQRRVLEFGELLRGRVLEKVAHRQVVFTIPKMLRPYFRHHRGLLSRLAGCAFDALKELSRAGLAREDVTPGAVVVIQTFGAVLNFHPHLHVLVTAGAFSPDGAFLRLPGLPTRALETVFRDNVLSLLLSEGLIDERRVRGLLSWRHSGFSVHVGKAVPAADAEATEQLAPLLLRPPKGPPWSRSLTTSSGSSPGAR